MVSSQGFNALLKLVEEPPEHVKFIFATTEPDKVIGTIRSRTHHYPFRLVPPKTMGDYLAKICVQEGVDVEPTVLPLVVRAGGGSFRDSLSVLDQLMGSSVDGQLSYDAAVALLGYTPESLLDEVVDAIAAHDGAGVFGVIDKVIESGQDPRRFAEDLLRRLRDLVIVQAVPDAVGRGLIEAPPELADRLANQASRLGTAEATRAAEVVNTGLTAMRGATAPRLLLELICARLLLPAVDDDMLGVAARLDRVERRLADGGAPAAPVAIERTPVAAPAPAVTTPAAPPPRPAPPPTACAGTGSAQGRSAASTGRINTGACCRRGRGGHRLAGLAHPRLDDTTAGGQTRADAGRRRLPRRQRHPGSTRTSSRSAGCGPSCSKRSRTTSAWPG